MRAPLYTPILSFVGLFLFAISLTVNMSLRFRITSDVGVAMLLSLANALLLIFTLLWSLLGVYEFQRLLKLNKELKIRFSNREIERDEYISKARRIKYCFSINISYLVLILIQLGYVIYNWNNEIEI